MSNTAAGAEKVIVAVVQATPFLLELERTVEKACALIEDAGKQGARVIVFPEAFLPGYPDWVWSVPQGMHGINNKLYAALLDQAVDIPGPVVSRLGLAAEAAGAYVAMGVNERNLEASRGSLFNTLLYLGPDGSLLGKHRKLIPTGSERTVWAQGDGSTLTVYDTPYGRLSGLICWENYMPLARYSLYAWGTQIYLAPTWDRGEPWLSTLRHIAKEGRVYVLGCCIAMRKSDLPASFDLAENFYGHAGDWINAGDSAIVDPDGNFIAGPCHEQEEILFAEIDLSQVRGAKRMLDVAGHYARPDVFELQVRTDSHPMIRTLERSTPPAKTDKVFAEGSPEISR